MSITAKISFGTVPEATAAAAAPTSDAPFRIGVLADFTGRQVRGVTGDSDDIAARRLWRVSRDNLDEVMAKLGVELPLPVGDDGATTELTFASLDDFHPDQLHDRVEQVADAYDSDEKSALMNSVLHHPDLQALESVWRGVNWLLNRLKGGQVEVVLLDISLAEAAADLTASDDLAMSGLFKVLVEKAIDGPRSQPCALLVGDYLFEPTAQHAEVLGRLARIAGAASAAFLTTLQPQVLDKSFAWTADAASAWQALRAMPEAARLGVALPRFLLRLPYGDNTQSIDKFSYEEMAGPPDRAHYLWGNPALACAALLGQAFQKQGWACRPGTVLDLDNLPIHVYTVDDEQESTLAEAWLVRAQAEQLIKLGIMPILCVRDKGAMQLAKFFSVAQPAKGQMVCAFLGSWTASASAAPPPAATPPPTAAPRAAPPPPKAAPPPPAEEPVAAEESAPPAEEEMDPDLAALLKQLE
jgi:type VI secretion system protein ImpC